MFKRYVVPMAQLSTALICLLALGQFVSSASAAPSDEPQRITTEPLSHWTMDDTFFYWSSRSPECDVFIPVGPRATAASATLKRRPINGGVSLTQATAAYCAFKPLAANENGVYYEDNPSGNQEESKILRRLRSDPLTPLDVESQIDGWAGKIVLVGAYAYWAHNNSILRVSQSGGEAELVTSVPTQVMDFTITGNLAIVADVGSVYFVDVGCSPLPCAPDLVTGTPAALVLDAGPGGLAGQFFLIERTNQQLQKLSCLPSGSDWQCQVGVLYDSPPGWHMNSLTGICVPKLGGICNGYSTFFMTEMKDDLTAGRILRASGSSPAQEIALGTSLADGIFVHEGYVYWAEKSANPGIYRLPFTAAPLVRDLEAAAWQVTQVTQNLDNDIPLVAGKETYVILYGRQLLGPPALTVEAELHGSRNGQPLLDSPLRPITAPRALTTGGVVDRSDDNQGWVFKLPAAWTAAGTLHLQGKIDARQIYYDATPANNSLEANFTFATEPDACLYFSPVRTHASLPSYTDPNFWPTLQRFQTLWPAAATHVGWLGEPVQELETCWWGPVPYPCYGPYELDQGWDVDNFPPDRDRVIMSLIARHTLNDISETLDCNIGGRTPVHMVGMVHPDSDTTSPTDDGGTITVGGYAWMGTQSSWVKFPDHAPPTSFSSGWPRQGGTLAHEVAHNDGRNHVDCPVGAPADPDGSYPYNTCMMDDGALSDPDTYFGFDPISHEIVRPNEAADIMSYASYRWMSDYTYKAIRDATFLQRVGRQAARNELAAANKIVYASGFYDAYHDQGGLNYAYELAAENLDTRRLADLLAPVAGSAAAPAGGNLIDVTGEIQLRDPNGAVLATREVSLIQNLAYGESTYYFTAAFPAPAGTVAKLVFLIDGQAVAELSPGIHPPVVTLLEPTAGANLDQTIRIRWQATDPDNDTLLHTVHYSPDNGESWVTLVTDYADMSPAAEVTLELQNPGSLPGSSSGSLIKVATSDGYHTTEVVSPVFTVAQRPPVVAISLPHATFDAGQEVVLMGGAYDAEEGSLSGAALQWRLNGVAAGSGSPASVFGLAPGTYDLALQATDSTARSSTATGELTVEPLGVPLAEFAPGLDGRCDDSAYAQAAVVGLKPYAAGQGTVQLVRTTTDLWACFSGLQRGSANNIGRARLALDADYSGGSAVQAGDLAFQIGEDGTPQRLVPSGAGNWSLAADPAGFAAKVTAEANVWRAEIRVPKDLIANWNDEVGLLVGHSLEGPGASNWPYSASYTSPVSWAHTILGDRPRLDSIEPQATTVEANEVEVTLDGRAFAENAVAYWNDTPLPTGVVDSTRLMVTVGANLLNAAGAYPITVRNPDLPEFPSEARSFVVENKQPTLTALTPEEAKAGGESFLLTVKGSGFVSGATVYWNGQARPTTFMAANQLRASIAAADLATATTIGVTVRNPDPSEGQSAALPFTVLPGEVNWALFLPSVVGGK